jgi:outer membrane receptor protein involved in Fe transport
MMNRCSLRLRVGLVLWLALILLNSPSTSGQSQITTGTIQGTITDERGGPLAQATLVIKHVATSAERTVITDSQGRYTAPLLQVGDYEITVSATGFGTVASKGYTLGLGQTLTANYALALGQTVTAVTVPEFEEVITVTSEAPLIETSRVETSTLVNTRSVDNLPLNGRRFLDLAFLTPTTGQERERGQLSLAGQRGINSNINIDGADFNQPFFGGQRGGERTDDAFVISQEAIREFQVIRAGFSPEFGRSSGGVVNAITKSGANDWHGGGFYYLRHREFAPRTVFGDDVAPVRQQFGGTLGGPIRRDKTFFFAAYDQQAQHQALVVRFNNTAGLPADLLARQGVFESTNDVHTLLARIDHQATNNTRITGRYSFSRNHALNGTFTGVTTGVLDNNGTERDLTHTGVFNVNTLLSARASNEFRWQYSYEERPRLNNGEGSDFTPTLGPQVQVSGCCFLGGVSFLPNVQDDSRLQFANNFSYLRGAHNFKVGFDWNRAHTDQIFRSNWRGVYIFNTIANYLDNLNRVPGAAADQFRVFFGPGTFDANQHDVAGFFQDTWRVHPRLTVTGGLRYEAELNPQPVKPNPLLPETARIPSDKKEWQPRLGLSWDLFGDSKTVFRASSGLFYARTPMLLLNQAFNANGNPDVGVSFTLNATQIRQARTIRPEFVFPFVPDTSSAANASFFTAAGIAGLRPDASFFASDFRNPRTFGATLGLERLVAPDLALALEWIHSNTVQLERIRDVNLARPAVGLDNSSPPVLRPLYNVSLRPNPNFNILRSQESSARSNYDALTLSLNRRYAKRYQFLTSYTLAYNRDDDSNERNFAGITYEDAFNIREEYRWSRNDIRHRWVFSGIYDLPFGILSSSILTYSSGLPFSAFTGTDSNRDSQFTDKPIISGTSLLRNAFRQPNFFNVDLRVSRSFKVRDQSALELMFDMFNVLNHRNFFYRVSTNESSTAALGSVWGPGQSPLATFRTIRSPDGTFNSNTAGVASPFQLQAALRYRF